MEIIKIWKKHFIENLQKKTSKIQWINQTILITIRKCLKIARCIRIRLEKSMKNWKKYKK